MKRSTIAALAGLTCCAVHLAVVAALAGTVGGGWAVVPVLVLFVVAAATLTHMRKSVDADHC